METTETTPAELTPATPAPTPEAKAEAKAEVAAAASAVAAEKIREARKAAAEKKAEPKPRRVGPLRKVHLTLLERHRAAQEPLVAELERLAARQQELRAQLGREARKVHEDLVEDLGDAIAANEASRTVTDDETGDAYVELTRRVVAR